jgi:hypothetical protein
VLGYCVISPIISGFGACFFLLSSQVWKYLFIWVQDQPSSRDTGGAFFPKAITHVFVGIYIQEVCLCALFFLARDQNGNVAALPQAILMIVLIVCTVRKAALSWGSADPQAAAHYVLIVSYKPLIHSLPLSLAHLSYGMAKETGHEGSVIGENTEDHDNSSTEHLTKPPQISLPDSPPPPAETSANGSFPPEKQTYQPGEAGSAENVTSVSNTPVDPEQAEQVPASRDFAFPANGIDDAQYPPPSLQSAGAHADQADGVATAPGPPVGSTHPEALEMGTIGQHPDPENEDDMEEPYFAVPGGPGVQRLEEEDENDPNAFFHPATKEPMRVLWLPRDELGLCEAEIEANRKNGIPSVHRYAVLNHKVGVLVLYKEHGQVRLIRRGDCRSRGHRLIDFEGRRGFATNV